MDGSVLAADVIIFYGPPHSGKSLYYEENLRATHQRVVPALEFQQTSDLTLRQLILSKVISPMKQGKKVVIDDENASYTKRDSFICLIKKKEPSCQVACLSFIPQYGETQLFWSREISLARRVECGLTGDEGYRINMAETDRVIDRWTNDKGSLDMPRLSEGYDTIKQIKTNFQVRIKYQLEAPCLLMEWDGLLPRVPADPPKPTSGVDAAVSTWAEHNPTGRVVIICDGNAFTTGTLSDRDDVITSILTSLTDSLSLCAVYLVHVKDPTRAGIFSRPPRPGLVAFVQRLLHANLYHKNSMYVYHTVPHMKMAEEAGIKYIKANRFFNHPALAKSTHACTTVAVPALLKALRILPDEPGPPSPSDRPPGALRLALADRALGADPCLGREDVGCGRTVYLAAKSSAVLKRYMKLCSSQASLVGEAQSVLSLVRQPSFPSGTPDLHSTLETPSTEPSATDSTDRPTTTQQAQRGLPDWMKPKHGTKRKLTKPKLKSMASGTTYVMTPDELLATAQLIIAEAEEDKLEEDKAAGQQDPVKPSPKPQETTKSPKPQETTKSPKPQDSDKSPKSRHPHKSPQKAKDSSSSEEEARPPPSKNSKTKSGKHTTPQKATPETSRKERHQEKCAPERKTQPSKSSPFRTGGNDNNNKDWPRHYGILDDLFDDGPGGSARRVRGPPSADSRGKGKQTRIGDYLRHEGTTPAKKKRGTTKKAESFTSSRVRPSKYFVPETSSAALRDNSIVFAESDDNDNDDDNSLLITDSMTQGPDSLFVCDSETEETPAGRGKNQRRKGSLKGGSSVTTVPETVPSQGDQKRPELKKQKHYSILDGLI